LTHYDRCCKIWEVVWIKDLKVVEPNPANEAIYNRYRELYVELDQDAKGLMHKIYDLTCSSQLPKLYGKFKG
jgi:hypothetical protein